MLGIRASPPPAPALRCPRRGVAWCTEHGFLGSHKVSTCPPRTVRCLAPPPALRSVHPPTHLPFQSEVALCFMAVWGRDGRPAGVKRSGYKLLQIIGAVVAFGVVCESAHGQAAQERRAKASPPPPPSRKKEPC